MMGNIKDRFPNDLRDDAKWYLGNDKDFSIEFDPANGKIVFYDETNSVTIMELPVDGTQTIDATSINTEQASLKDVNEEVVTESVSGATDIDLSSGNIFKHTLTGDVTYSFTNVTSDPAGNSFTLIVVQDGTGGRSITYPASVEWHNGTAPTLDTSADNKSVLTFISPDGGTTWIGSLAADKVA